MGSHMSDSASRSLCCAACFAFLPVVACVGSVPEGASSTSGGAKTSGTAVTSTGSVTSSTGATTAGRSSTSSGSGSDTSSLAGNSSGSSTGAGPGGPCVTAADCVLGQVCLDGGACGNGGVGALLCTGVGETCGPGAAPCCQGSCTDGGFCSAFTPCAGLGASCGSAGDCCQAEACGDGGVCVSACGLASTPCAQNGDCCTARGLLCLPPTVPDGNPLECRRESLSGAPGCTPTAQAGVPQCNLGTACALDGGDPCAPAGYVCDATFQVCREPLIYESCLPGGPPCQGLADTTLDDLQCGSTNEGNECLQPCRETSDCSRAADHCAGDGNGHACFGNYGCTDYFGACDAAGTSDGTCVPTVVKGQVEGLCYQAADGGPTCSSEANRQSGGFCPAGEWCLGGLCDALCNAGTSGSPGCGTSANLPSDQPDHRPRRPRLLHPELRLHRFRRGWVCRRRDQPREVLSGLPRRLHR